MKKILLAGNPNVGKSAVFSRLTGTRVLISNYPGSTVEYSQGQVDIGGIEYAVIDVPGTYSLSAESDAEKVATDMLGEGDIIVNVLDSTNLERNIFLTMQLLKLRKPMVIVLNIWDDTKHLGIKIDADKLSEILNVPVITTVAVIGVGITRLKDAIPSARVSDYDLGGDDIWKHIGSIIGSVQSISHRHHTFLERLSDILIKPVTGIPIAGLILMLSFEFTRFIGETLISAVLDPLYLKFYAPFVIRLVSTSDSSMLSTLLLGADTNAMSGFGILTTGVYIPLVVVLPYIFSFYLVLSVLEDSGYLPRLAVLLDSVMHKFGLHGYGTIPVILGLGCKVPAILATRILEKRREKLLATVLILLTAPCMPQTAMIISILLEHGASYIALTLGIIIFMGLISGYLLNKLLKGDAPELFIEIPPIRKLRPNMLLKKMWLRMKGFVLEAIPLIMLGVLIVNICEMSGLIGYISAHYGRSVTWILGLPEDAFPVILFGFLRKDVSISLLAPYGLNAAQLVVSCVFLTLYLPCISTFFVISRELGLKSALKISAFTFTVSLLLGGLLNLVLS